MWGYIPGGAAIATARRAKYQVTRKHRKSQAHAITQLIFWAALAVIFFAVIL
jgi:hypothetical protein